MLNTMKTIIVDRIVDCIKKHQKSCIIFYSTQDLTKKEANVLLVRYLEVDSNGRQYPTERLLEVFTTGETTGTVLTDTLLDVWNVIKFDIEWIVGQ